MKPMVSLIMKVLAFIRDHPKITPEQLVEWDRQNGKHLFDWEEGTNGNG